MAGRCPWPSSVAGADLTRPPWPSLAGPATTWPRAARPWRSPWPSTGTLRGDDGWTVEWVSVEPLAG